MIDERIRRLRHDLANPLSAILAETQLLLLDEADLNANTQQGLKDIESLARRMRRILEETG